MAGRLRHADLTDEIPLIDLATRQREEEWMDGPGVDPATLDHSLRFIRRINTFLGYRRATLHHLRQFSYRWAPGETIRILDVATGSADIPLAIAKWSRGKPWNVQVIGLDRHPVTAEIARQQVANHPTINIVRGDALQLPFEPETFDYVLTNMFLHHLDDDGIVQAIREMNRVAKRGIIVADLLRDRRAYLWISLFTAFSSPMLKHDARVSVAQALTEPEVLTIRDRAGASYAKFNRHFGHRFVLAGEKM